MSLDARWLSGLAVGPEAKHDVLALVLADAVAVGVAVTGIVEELVRLGDVEVTPHPLGGLPAEVRVPPVAGWHEGVSGESVPVVGDVLDLLAVDRVLERGAKALVAQHRVPM
jgi:hypothetical protein